MDMRYRRHLPFKITNVALPLIVINIIIFVLQAVLGSWFTESFMLVSADVLSRPWILVTSMFLHANTAHLFFNMYALLIFGPLIESRIGPKRFLIIYFLSGIIAAGISTFFYNAALGASGAIMGIIGITIMLLPNLPVLLFFFIPMTLRTAGIIFALIEVFGVFVPSGIANIAHLAGLGCGVAYGYYLRSKKSGFARRFTAAEEPRMSGKKKKGNASSMEMSQEDIEDYLKYGRL